ncbi:MAG: hypothetical protein ACON4H_10720 [Rubripirellula sp.]
MLNCPIGSGVMAKSLTEVSIGCFSVYLRRYRARAFESLATCLGGFD